ncbi:four helix bundle protein [candidate division KSB1 bacterium]
MNNKVKSYKDLIVWQKAIDLVVAIYSLTDNLPKSELFDLTSQIRRAAVSIPANISEGSRRSSKKEFAQFLKISYGSGAELETLIIIIKKLPFGKNLNYTRVDSLLIEIMKMLNGMLKSLSS